MALFQENAPKKPVAVIILNWNGVKLLREFLPSVIRHTNSDIADVIVADNGSSDDSLLVLEREFPEALVLPLDKNYGYAEGYNRAIRATHYEYTILLNSDVEVTPHWVEPLYDYCSTHRTVAACQLPRVWLWCNPREAPPMTHRPARTEKEDTLRVSSFLCPRSESNRYGCYSTGT